MEVIENNDGMTKRSRGGGGGGGAGGAMAGGDAAREGGGLGLCRRGGRHNDRRQGDTRLTAVEVEVGPWEIALAAHPLLCPGTAT
jgi:hypothetical protein